MITTIKQAKGLAKKFNALKTDKQRLVFLKEQHGNMRVVLDNDCTMVGFNLDGFEDEVYELVIDIELDTFDEYHGWTDGVVELFKFAGIDVETC